MKNTTLLCDLQGMPFYFFRGKDTTTGFWSNLVALAKERYNSSIWVANISVKNPIVVDCKNASYGSMRLENLQIAPSTARLEILSFAHDTLEYSETNGAGDFGPDDFATFLHHYTQYDAIILKNIREGLFEGYPIYDVIVYDEQNIVNIRKLSETEYEKMNQYAIKRIDLSKYITEEEEDGLIKSVHKNGYAIKWVLDPELYKYRIILDIVPGGGKSYKYAQLTFKGKNINPDDPLNPDNPIEILQGASLDITRFGEEAANRISVYFREY